MRLFILIFFAFSSIFCLATTTNSKNTICTETHAKDERVVVFRTTQYLKSKDGREIYLYPSRKCELFINGRLAVTCTYRLQDGELRLLDEYGDTVYKGSYILSRDRRTISSLKLGYTTYYRKQ